MRRVFVFSAVLGSGFALGVLLVALPIAARAGVRNPASRNGDVNGDGALDISDAVYVLHFLFKGGDPPVALADSPDLLARLNALEAGLEALRQQSLSAEQREILGHMSIEGLSINDRELFGAAKTIRFTVSTYRS